MNISPSQKLKSMGLVLPPAPPPAGVYKPVLVVDNFLYVSGQGPMQNDSSLMVGRAGDDLNLEHGFHETKQGIRFTISEEARREVLQRLLRLNHERYKEEVVQGLHDKKKKKASTPRKKKKIPVKDDGQMDLF